MAAAAYNLLDEPWIPVLRKRDGTLALLSLPDVLGRASELRDITDASPLVVISLYRLLLAVLHRNFGPETPAAWKALWRQCQWDSSMLDRYFSLWHDRFDLFGERHPFYQVANLDFAYAVPIAKLTHELASGNNATLFDHTSQEVEATFTAPQAARRLVALQAFAVGGLVSLEKGQNPAQYKSAKAGPLTKGAVTLIKGDNVFETLALNLHQYSKEHEKPFPFGGDDVPAWERATPEFAGERIPTGYLDLLTWQSRRVRLQADTDAEGRVLVRQAVIMKGQQFPDAYVRYGRETMIAFRKDAQPKPGQDPWPAVAFQEERAVWRDSLALLQSDEGRHARPSMLDWLNELLTDSTLGIRPVLPLGLYGLSVDRAKVFFWRSEQLPVPLRYLDDQELFAALGSALSLAERVAVLFATGFDTIIANGEKRVLPRPFQLLGNALLSASDGRKPPDDVIRKIVEHLAPGRAYWAQLEIPFKDLMINLPGDRTPDEDTVIYGLGLRPVWGESVKHAARNAFREATSGLDASARTLKAVARAERQFNSRLSSIVGAYLPRVE